jgi:hypothetical protein
MSLIGCVDTLSETLVEGWVADQSNLECQVFVYVVVNSAVVATLRGGIYREDLRQAGIGDGCKAFQFNPGPYLRPGPNIVEVRHAGTDLSLSNGHAILHPVCAPVLAHIHVPKCAGTSFRMLLERHFGARHMRLYVDDTYFVYDEGALAGLLSHTTQTLAFSSHHVRTFPARLACREIVYVTFLRDPIQQFISYMTHAQKHYAAITSQSLLEALPPNTPQLSLREFARWLLTSGRDIPFRENHNVNFFARHSFPLAPDRLEAAKTALSGFFFVGITEKMDESVRELQALAAREGLDFPEDAISVENTSGDYRGDLSWIHRADEVGALLMRSIEKDRQLYDWATERLEADFWNHKPRKRPELSVGRA